VKSIKGAKNLEKHFEVKKIGKVIFNKHKEDGQKASKSL
jgi:hypothetical protein